MKKKVVVFVSLFMLFPLLIACNGARLTQPSPVIPTPIIGIQQPPTEPSIEPTLEAVEPVVEPTIEPIVEPVEPIVEPVDPIVEPVEPPAPITELDPFAVALVTAVSNHDYTTMTSFMSDQFVIGHYGSEGLIVSQSEAGATLQTGYALPSHQIKFPNANHDTIANMMGYDPFDAMDPNVTPVRAIYSQGWGQNGQGDAVLIVAEQPDGAFYWYGMMYAHTSFVTQQPAPDSPTRIAFESGATSAIVHGLISEPGSDEYLLRALAGQLMTVKIESPNNDVRLSLVGLDDGQPLSRADTGATYWRGVLQGSQDYSIRAVYNGANSNYKLTVDVQPIPEAQGAVTIPIQFAPGETGLTASGKLAEAINAPHRYELIATAGQFMSVTVRQITGEAKPVVTIYAPELGIISPDGFAKDQQHWVGQLPKTGTYTLLVNAKESSVDYVLDIEISNVPVQPVQFAPGNTGITVNGLAKPFEPVVYAVEAAAGQVMAVSLDAHHNFARVDVEIVDRSLYLGHDSINDHKGWLGTLPVSTAYFIYVTSDVPLPFNLHIDITTPPPPVAAANCPVPTANQSLFTAPEDPFCFLFQKGLRMVPSYGHGGIRTGFRVTSPPVHAGLEPSATSMGIYAIGEANGRSLEELAQEVINEFGGVGTFEETTLGGQPAITIDTPNAPVPMKQLVFIHNDTAYRLIFAPFGYKTPITVPSIEDLYALVIDSFAFVE